jgi:predicted nucleotidyltransferase
MRHPALAPQLHALLARYRATNLAVFGSVARDQALPDSDVDLLVDLPTGLSLFERADLKPELRQRVEAEAIAI